MRGADNNDVPRNDRRGMKTDFAVERINILVIIEFEIDDAVLAEPSHQLPVLRVQRDELIAGGDVENAFVISLNPIGQPTPRQLPRCGSTSRPFALGMGP